MNPSDFWKTPGYTMKPRPTEPRNVLPFSGDPAPVQPLAPHQAPRNLVRFPSGLEVEDMTERNPRPLWPLVVSALLIWAAVIGSAWYLAA